MSQITVSIKPTSGGDKFSVTAEPSGTVLELKEEVAKHCSIPAAEQRLIYKGQVLKEERDLASYGVQSEHVVHLVRGRPTGSSNQSGSAGSATVARGAPAAPNGNPMGLPAGLMAPGGDPGQMQDMFAQMANSPMMQQILNNPELLRTMMQANPAVQQLMERNPELAQLFNNPQMLREALQTAGNPALLREQMRTTDRAMSNIESHPGGFNALRRMYENIQEPLMNATTSGDQPANPFAALLGGGAAAGAAGTAGNSAASGAAPAASGAPNTAPLPNPWAPNPPAGGAGAGAQAGGLGGLGGLGDLGALAGMGGMGGMPGGADMNAVMQMMQNPAMQQMMESMLSQPGMMEAMINSNPQLRSMADANPMMRETLRNPDMLRQMLNPQNMQAMAQMQAAMQQLQASGLGNLAGGPMPGVGAPGAAGGQLPDMSALLGALGGAVLAAWAARLRLRLWPIQRQPLPLSCSSCRTWASSTVRPTSAPCKPRVVMSMPLWSASSR